MATCCAVVPLAHANQLPLPRLQSAAVHESHVSSAISSSQDLYTGTSEMQDARTVLLNTAAAAGAVYKRSVSLKHDGTDGV